MLVRIFGFGLVTMYKLVCQKSVQKEGLEPETSAHAPTHHANNTVTDEFDTEIRILYTNVTP